MHILTYGYMNYVYINACTCTYLLTPWYRVLPEQLTGLQLVKIFPAFHGTRMFHYRTHKRPPPVSILGQSNPVHIPTSHLLEIQPNIIHPSTPRYPQWFFPSGFHTKTLYTMYVYMYVNFEGDFAL